jgi:single-stranded-DNA-specific exonuclease
MQIGTRVLFGLVAGRLSDRFNRPAIVLAGNGTNAIGSARAPLGQNILSILTKGSTHLSKFGGHNQAAGFTLEKNKVAAFKEALSVEVKDKQPVDLLNQVTADAVVSSHLVSRPTADMIASLAPFGEGNPEPSFIIRNVPLMNWRPVGKTKNHAKCTFWINGQAVDGIGFGLAEKLITESSLKGTPTTIYGRIEENEFRGRKSLQLTIMDIAADDKVKIQSL